MYLLGYDIGSSSIKASLLEAASGAVIAAATSPGTEMPIRAVRPGWAEQEPALWWEHVVAATAAIRARAGGRLREVAAVGIAYQMHGLVLVDRDLAVLRPAIIWCDSRAVSIGERAFAALGPEQCLGRLLNSPGNFTAAKLRWVREHEPETYRRVHAFMLPGDYIAARMTGEIRTTASGLSEAILWDFREGRPAELLLAHYDISPDLIPPLVDTFSVQGRLTTAAAAELGLTAGVPVSYRAGDQPNNALALNVLHPGEMAATAGTSGVVYGVSGQPVADPRSRVNTFLHVNHTREDPRCGVLLCVNATGILNSWLKAQCWPAGAAAYDEINAAAAQVPVGAAGLTILPFGNGAERTLGNRNLGASIHGLQVTVHTRHHLARAVQEGIVFALYFGIGTLREMGLTLDTVRAGHANMFLSPVFCEAFAAITGARIELYQTDGSQGAARGAGIGVGIFPTVAEAFAGLQVVRTIQPQPDLTAPYLEAYDRWSRTLERALAGTPES